MQYERYVEPFAGSCSLFYRLEPARALLGDKNDELIHTYQVLRRQPVAVYEAPCDPDLLPDRVLLPYRRQHRVRDIARETLIPFLRFRPTAGASVSPRRIRG
jgi:hypothetical protein